MKREIYKYQGAIHIHTKYSDGTGNVDEISKAAKSAGLSWIIITDHNYIDSDEGIYNDVYVIKGYEYSPKTENHYLILGTNTVIPESCKIDDVIKKVNQDNGFGFAAHPDEQDKRNNPYKPIKWIDKSIEPDGVEIWNWFSQWGDKYDSRNILTVIYSYLFKNQLVKKPYSETLAWWDKLNSNHSRIVPAICGVDAHALLIKKYILPIKIFPYKFSFKTLTNEIILNEKLSSDFEYAKFQIIDALKNGKNIMLNKMTYNKSPEIFVSNTDYKAYSGETVVLDNETYLHIKSDKILKIIVFKDGLKYNEIKGECTEFQLSQKGKYRVELELGNKGYVYTNPIAVR